MPNTYYYSYTAKTGELVMKVTDERDKTVWEMKYPSHVEDKVSGDLIEEPTLIDMHLMGSVADVEGLGKLLKQAGIIPEDSEVVKKNSNLKTGGVTRKEFDTVVENVAEHYEGKPVPPKYQDKYGKRYSHKSALSVGYATANTIFKDKKKFAEGGHTAVAEDIKYILLADFEDDDILFAEGLSRNEALVKFKELTHKPNLLYAEVYYNDTNGNGYVTESHTVKLFQKYEFAEGGIVSPFQFGDAVDYIEDGPENEIGTPKYRKGLTGHIVNIKKEGDDFVYSVRSGMTTREDIPGSHLKLHDSETKQKVEEILNEKQKSKTFKDVGKRVTGSAKEKRAYSMITFSDLKNIEEDEITAMELVTKQRVYPEVNVAEQRAIGVSSGAAYIKIKIREACANKPPNDKSKRASFILFIENFTKVLNPLKTVAEVKDYLYALQDMPADQIIGYFMDQNFFSLSEEMKQKSRDEFKKSRLSFLGSSLVFRMLEGIFSKRFANFLYRRSDAAKSFFSLAEQYEAISDEQSAALIEKYKYNKTKFIEANEEEIKKYQDADEKTLLTKLIFNWTGLNRYKKDAEGLRNFAVGYYRRRIEQAKTQLENIPTTLLPRPDNWEWFDGEKSKKIVVRSGEITINSGTPLSYIKRTNGIAVEEKYVDAAANTDPSDNPIIRDFGFASVQFGNALTDARAKEHIRHFLASIIDMSEALNIQIKYFNKIGGLSMAFASRGKGKAMAHYERGRAIINLTNNNGDGTVAHEFGHYFDNALTIYGKGAVSLKFGSEDLDAIDNYAIRNKMNAIVEFIKNGKEGITPQVYVTFKAAKELAEKPPRYYNEQKRQFEEVELFGDIDTTIKNLAEKTRVIRGLAADDFERREAILSYVIKAFDMDEYDVAFNTKQSAFAFYSSKMRSKYWTSIVEMFARAWETFIFDKLQRSGHNNNYLVSGEYFDQKIPVSVGGFTYIYPFGAERKYLFTLYDDLVQTVKKEMELPDFTPPGDKREDEYIVFDKKGEREVVDEDGKTEVEVEAFAEGGKLFDEDGNYKQKNLKGKQQSHSAEVTDQDDGNIENNSDIKEFSDGGEIIEMQDLIIDQSLDVPQKQDLVFAEGSNVSGKTIVEINSEFNERLKEIVKDDNKNFNALQLGHPSTILLSCGIPNLPIEISVHTILHKKEQANHPFEISSVIDAPVHLANPICVFKSKTRDDSVVVLTEMRHRNIQMVAAIELRRRKSNAHINSIRSIYPKDQIKDILKWIVEHDLLEYCNKQKALNWLGKQRSNSAEVTRLIKDSTKIIKGFENPNIGYKKGGSLGNQSKKSYINADGKKGEKNNKTTSQKKRSGFRGDEKDVEGTIQKTLSKEEGGLLRSPTGGWAKRSGKSPSQQVIPGDKKLHSKKSPNSKLPK